MDTLPPVVNHHADYPGFSGPVGLALGLVMLAAGRKRARTVAELAAVTTADRVIDIGCGAGGVAAAAARRGARVTGVDPSQAMLRLGRTLFRSRAIRWARAGAEDLPVPDGAATVALAIATVHHWPDVTAGLHEIRRVLAPGGRLLTVERQAPADATGRSSHGWTDAQTRAFAEQCRSAGFADVQIDRRALRRHDFWTVRAVRP